MNNVDIAKQYGLKPIFNSRVKEPFGNIYDYAIIPARNGKNVILVVDREMGGKSFTNYVSREFVDTVSKESGIKIDDMLALIYYAPSETDPYTGYNWNHDTFYIVDIDEKIEDLKIEQ